MTRSKQEIEKKYQVDLARLPGQVLSEAIRSYPIRQGYLNTRIDQTVRLRDLQTECILTIKGRKVGATAPEYEYKIHPDNVSSLREELSLISEGAVIEKTRYELGIHNPEAQEVATERYGVSVKEMILDIFEGDNEGLGVLEIEFLDTGEEDNREERLATFIQDTRVVPSWCTDDVTADFRYTNLKLAQKSYKTWDSSDNNDNNIIRFARELLSSNLHRDTAAGFEQFVRSLEFGIDNDTLAELHKIIADDARSLKWE